MPTTSRNRNRLGIATQVRLNAFGNPACTPDSGEKIIPFNSLPPDPRPSVALPSGTVGPWRDRPGKRVCKAVVRRQPLCDVDPMSETAVKTLPSPEVAALVAKLGNRTIVLV